MSEPPGAVIGPRPRFVRWAILPVGGSVLIWAASTAVLMMIQQPAFVFLTTPVVVTAVYPIMLAWSVSMDGARARAEPDANLGAFLLIWIGVVFGILGLGVAFNFAWMGVYFEFLRQADGGSSEVFLFFLPLVLIFPVLGFLAGGFYTRFLAKRIEIDPEVEDRWRRAHSWGGALTGFLMVPVFVLFAGLADSGPLGTEFFALGVGAVIFNLLPHNILAWRCYRRRLHPETLIEVF